MWRVFWIVIVISSYKEKVYAIENNVFEFTVEQIAISNFLHKSTIFVNHASLQQDSFIKRISSQLPSLMVNSIEVETTTKNISLNLQIFEKMKNSKLFIVFHDSIDPDLCLKHLFRILNFIVYNSPKTRPKFMVVLFAANFPSEKSLRELLSYGWSLKFLDFSLIKVNTDLLNSQYTILSYNPFTQVYINEEFNSTTNIFPDKLINLWGYRFNVPYFHKPPFFIITEDEKKATEKIEGISYSLLKILSNKLNFSLEMQKLNNCINYRDMFVLFKKTKAKMSMIPVVVSVLNDTDFLMGRIVIDQRFIMIVPVLKVSRVDNLHYLFISLSCFIVILICFAATVYIMKFPSDQWKIIDIYQILLAVSLSRRPQKSTQRIVYFSVILVSMKYSGDIFAKLTGIKVKHEEMPFDTFDDIISSKIPVFMDEIFETEIYYRTDQLTRNLKMKPSIYIDFGECFHNLVTRKNAICITNDIYGQFILKKYNNPINGKVVNSKNLMKLAKPELYHDKTTVFYETASPFVLSVEKVYLRIFESGLPISWNMKSINQINETEDEEGTKNIFLWEVITIAAVGYLISVGVFLVELMVNYVQKTKIKL